MIDLSLRIERIADAAADPACAVLLLDVVLGYGAHPDPARYSGRPSPRPGSEAAAAVVVPLIGSAATRRAGAAAAGLAAAGAMSSPVNAAAARFAATRSRARPVTELLDEPPVVSAGLGLFADAPSARPPSDPGRLDAADGGHRG